MILARQSRIVCMIMLLIVSCASVRETRSATSMRHRNGRSELTSQERKHIVDYAMSLVGTRYRYGGCSPGQGFDCSGFTTYVMQRYGYKLPRTSSGQSGQGRVVRISDAQPGDLVFFGRGKHVDHVAIVVKSNKNCLEIVHSSSSGGVLVEDALRSPYWKKRTLFAVDLESL